LLHTVVIALVCDKVLNGRHELIAERRFKTSTGGSNAIHVTYLIAKAARRKSVALILFQMVTRTFEVILIASVTSSD
jgi:hypothetical protein